MFKQRLMTSLVLIPLVLALLFYANLPLLIVVVFLILMACGWEWAQLIPTETTAWSLVFLVVLAIVFWFCSKFYPYWLGLGLMAWIAVLFAVLFYPASEAYWGKKTWVALAGLVFLPLFSESLVKIIQLPSGRALLVQLFFLVWAADIGAYLTGKQWGRHKLIAKVSPGKSWEGLLGGLSLALLIAVVGYYIFYPGVLRQWLGLVLAVVLISVLGDLLVSMLKRRCHVKDSGALLPGHGGILDRLDSLIAAAPLYYALFTCCLVGA